MYNQRTLQFEDSMEKNYRRLLELRKIMNERLHSVQKKSNFEIWSHSYIVLALRLRKAAVFFEHLKTTVCQIFLEIL